MCVCSPQPCFLTLKQKDAKLSGAQGGPASWHAHKKVVWPLRVDLTSIVPVNHWERKWTLTGSQMGEGGGREREIERKREKERE